MAPYQSAAGRALLDRRHLSQNRPLPQEPTDHANSNSPFRGGAAAVRGGLAYVPTSIDRIGNGSDYSKLTQRFYNNLGYNAIANHEMEHANDQPGLPGWVAAQRFSVGRVPVLARLSRERADLAKRPAVPKSLPDKHYTHELDRHLEFQRDYAKAQAEQAAIIKAYEDSGAKGIVESPGRKYDEIGPSIGDLVFRSEQFAKEHGKPLEHTVNFPNGKQHDINWMREQAQQHGYWDGQSMDSLLMDNTAGQQWLRDAAGIASPNQTAYNPNWQEKRNSARLNKSGPVEYALNVVLCREAGIKDCLHYRSQPSELNP